MIYYLKCLACVPILYTHVPGAIEAFLGEIML